MVLIQKGRIFVLFNKYDTNIMKISETIHTEKVDVPALRQLMRDNDISIKQVVTETKLRQMNGGVGFAEITVSKVLSVGDRYNTEIIKAAQSLVEAEQKRREEIVAEIA